jgi:hypothetical protein
MKTLLLSLFCLFALAISAAAQTVVVTPTNAASLGWTTDDTRPGGAVNFVMDTSSPAPVGALQLTTDGSVDANGAGTAKAQFLKKDILVPLSQVSQLSYYTKQNAASFAGGDPSYQLLVCLGGFSSTSGCSNFTTMVFEPYQMNGTDPSTQPVINGVWQSWDAYAGKWWSSRTRTVSSSCAVVAGFGGPPFYTIPDLASACPDAVAVGFGVNIGSNNPNYNVESDLVSFNGTAYDFEPYIVARAQDQCKNGGWNSVKRANGTGFRNQGDCIQYVNTGK